MANYFSLILTVVTIVSGLLWLYDAKFLKPKRQAIVAEVEKKLGIPVTTSNHAMAWHCMRLSGIRKKISNFGKLYQF